MATIKLLRGVLDPLSGVDREIVVQKNNVIRAKRIVPKRKRGNKKNSSQG